MGKKKAFALRLDEEVLEAIEKWASDEFRSVNGQIEWVIFQALKKNGRLRKNNSEDVSNLLEDNSEAPQSESDNRE